MTSNRPAAQRHSRRLAPGCWFQLVTLGMGSRRTGLWQILVARGEWGTVGSVCTALWRAPVTKPSARQHFAGLPWPVLTLTIWRS